MVEEKEIKAKKCSKNYGNKLGNLAQPKPHPVIEQVNFWNFKLGIWTRLGNSDTSST